MRMIRKKKAYLLYLPPYSPDLNPIEKMFHVYISALKIFSTSVGSNKSAKEKHIDALLAVTEEIALNEFRHCGVPTGTYMSSATKRKLVDFVAASILIKKIKR